MVSKKNIGSFFNNYLLKHHFVTLVGFYAGCKLTDYLFYEDKIFQIQREQIEDEYWAKNGKIDINIGEPTELQPTIQQSTRNQNIMRKTWINIFYEKDKMVKKIDKKI